MKKVITPACIRQRHRGFTLIEMLVSLAIGLFIMLGLTVAFVNMKSAFNTQDQLGQLQDNERLAISVLTSTVRSAGYFPKDSTSLSTVRDTELPAVSAANYDLAAGQGLAGKPAAGAVSEILTSRFKARGGDGLTDCLGNNASTIAPTINTFYVAGNELMCAVTGAPAPVSIVGNVTSMTVQYGIENSSTDRQYLAIGAMSASTWPLVKVVRITLTFRNPYDAAGTPVTWTQIINLMNS